MDRSRQFTADGEKHRVFKKNGDVYVDHVAKSGGKWDVINLTDKAGAKTVEQGVKATKKYHSKGKKKK